MNTYLRVMDNVFRNERFSDERLEDTGGILNIQLSAHSRCITLTFDSYFVYRKLDEGDALHIIKDIAESTALSCGLYLVTSSDFLQWFSKQSEGIHDKKILCHYCVATTDSIIDVIALSEPSIEES